MAIEDRRERERAARRRLIITTARKLAEADGWDAVTTRRLSTEIEYSQPVLYKHFTGMEQIADAVAIDGFGELADVIRAARSRAGTASDALTHIAHAYLDFAHDNPAVYDAMFTRATTLRFAAQDTSAQLMRPSPSCAKRSAWSLTNRMLTLLPKCSGPRCTDWSPLAVPADYALATTRSVSNCSSNSSPADEKRCARPRADWLYLFARLPCRSIRRS